MNSQFNPYGRSAKRNRRSQNVTPSAIKEAVPWLSSSISDPTTTLRSPDFDRLALFGVAHDPFSPSTNSSTDVPRTASSLIEDLRCQISGKRDAGPRQLTASSGDASDGANETMPPPHQLDSIANRPRPFSQPPVIDHSTEEAYPYSSAFDTEEYPWDLVSHAKDICDASECAAETCDTCESCEETCFLPCATSDECRSGSCLAQTCFDENCLSSSQPTQSDYQTPLLDQCEWVGNGENCPAVVHTASEKVEHVTESHIRPQSQITCEWDSCGRPTDINQLPNHLWFDHYHEPEMYSCLWQGCDLMFTTHEELDTHFKTAHVYLNCHWAGCEVTAADQQELQAHFNRDHLHIDDSNEHHSFASQELLPNPSSESLMSRFHPPMSLPTLTQEPTPPIERLKTPNIPGLPEKDPQKPELKGPKVCKWLKGPDDNPHECGQIFKDGNHLQEHIHLDHIRHLKPDELKCRWPGCTYTQTAKDKSKLNRHTYRHSSYCYGACRICHQPFSEKSKLLQHEATHLNEKPFPCSKCDRRFPTQNALTNHERTHKGEKPLVCGMMVKGVQCTYRCSDPSNMSTHKKKHSPPQFRCPVCERAFCRNDTLKRHMITHSTRKTVGRKRGFATFADAVVKHPR